MVQDEILELGCRVTELEEILAGLRIEREKLYAALDRQISERMFHERQLRYEIAALTEERDAWKNKAVEISHALTYAAECSNHKGLRLVKEPEADGPSPEMFIASKP